MVIRWIASTGFFKLARLRNIDQASVRTGPNRILNLFHPGRTNFNAIADFVTVAEFGAAQLTIAAARSCASPREIQSACRSTCEGSLIFQYKPNGTNFGTLRELSTIANLTFIERTIAAECS